MLEMSWITAILQLYSQVADLFGNVILKRINIRLFLFIGTISLHIESPSYVAFGGLFSRNFEIVLFAFLLLDLT